MKKEFALLRAIYASQWWLVVVEEEEKISLKMTPKMMKVDVAGVCVCVMAVGAFHTGQLTSQKF